jgi:hypothetical protein
VPCTLDDVVACWAFVGLCLFNAVHVAACREVVVGEFDDKYLGAPFEG